MKMLDGLKKIIHETPLEQLQAEFKEIEKQFPDGVNAFEFLDADINKAMLQNKKELSNDDQRILNETCKRLLRDKPTKL